MFKILTKLHTNKNNIKLNKKINVIYPKHLKSVKKNITL